MRKYTLIDKETGEVIKENVVIAKDSKAEDYIKLANQMNGMAQYMKAFKNLMSVMM